MSKSCLAYWPIAFLFFVLTGCKGDAPTGLTDSNIRQAITDMNNAAAKFDADAICAMLDDSVVISLKQVKFSGPEATTMKKDEYCRFTSEGMRALRQAGATYETSTVVDQINIAPGGLTAEVKYASTDRVVAGGRTLRSSFAGTSSLIWRDGRVMVTSVRGVVQFSN